MVRAPGSIQPRSSCYDRTLSKRDTLVKVFCYLIPGADQGNYLILEGHLRDVGGALEGRR